MARIKRKGKSGAAKNFITRSAAVTKLQVSLADFRRLCIFKGIFPREPRSRKKANKGSTKSATFYYSKDIQYLLHEPVLVKFREQKSFAKKLSKALSKNELGDADRLEKSRPKYTLDHLVRERYPSFLDALRDLDDSLNMLFLFANMPATTLVSHRVTKDAAKLTNQWLAFVAKEGLIKKVFVSIKGVYYQANVKGQEVRWLVPFKFPTNIPSDVDFKIMLTFLEFYSTMLHFVLFKLYADAALVFPPPINTEQLKGIGGLSSYVLKSKQDGMNTLFPNEKASEKDQGEEKEEKEEGVQLSVKDIERAKNADADADADAQKDDEDVENDNVETVQLDEFASVNRTAGDLLDQPSDSLPPNSTLFSNFTFFVGREVPLDILEFCILSAGGKFVSEIALDELKLKSPEGYAKLDLSTITHLIVDRPKMLNFVAGRTYVQPQWVFDSINKAELLPVSQYAVGETLPPHLSPWGDAGKYNPEAPANADYEESSEDEKDKIIVGEELAEEQEEGPDEDLKQQRELELEAAGVKYSDIKASGERSKKRKSGSQKSVEDSEKELKTIMMTKKMRTMYNSMQEEINKIDTRAQKLAKKRKQMEKTKKQLEKL